MDNEKYINLAEALIESNKEEVIEMFSGKLNQLKECPDKIFDEGEYYYDTENNKFQAWRGEIEEDIEWLLLIDTLQFNGILRELDWENDPEEANACLKALAESKEYILTNLSVTNSQDAKSLDGYFNAKNIQLGKNELAAISLYIDSDSYVIGLVKTKNIDSIIEHANICGQRITKY
jgi:hypothetical protein